MDQRHDPALAALERLETARAAHEGRGPRPLCVLQVVPELDTGGAERTTVDIAAALVAEGDRAIVASEGGRMVNALTALGGEHVRLPVASKNPVTMRQNAAKLAALMEEKSVDIIHARSRAPAWSSLWAAAWTRRPLVTTYHGAYTERTAFKNRYNSVMARGDVVIANSGYTAALVARRHRFAADRIITIPRGTDTAHFLNLQPADGAAMRKAWSVEENVPVILHLARLTSWKGQDVLLTALARLQQAFPRPWVCVFAGADQGRSDYKAALEARATTLELSQRVRFPGHVDNVPAAFAATTLAVMPSVEPEAFGRAAVEAQAAGVPVVVSDHGAVRETVLAPPEVGRDMRTGWRVPPGDAEALADSLFAALQTSQDGLKAIGLRGRAHAQANFSLDAMTRKTLGVYHSLLEDGVSALY